MFCKRADFKNFAKLEIRDSDNILVSNPYNQRKSFNLTVNKSLELNNPFHINVSFLYHMLNNILYYISVALKDARVVNLKLVFTD